MTDLPKQCVHAACTCVALEGNYCSEHCRAAGGDDSLTCACGHKDCAGSMDDADIAAG